MRTKILFISNLIVGLIFLSSCEQVIELDLNNADSRIVIEGNISDEPGSCVVKLSRVANYNASNTPLFVIGASVTIIDNGISYELEEISPGNYVAPTLTGTPGHTYQLVVETNGETFNSTCRMPERIELDTLYLDEEVFFIDTNLTINFEFQDIPNIKNYYRYVLIDSDNENAPNILVDDDTFFDGQNVEQRLISFNDLNLPGDTIELQLLCIDEAVNLYFSTLASIIDGSSGQLAAPANPTSNIIGGAIGYFNAYTISRRYAIVP